MAFLKPADVCDHMGVKFELHKGCESPDCWTSFSGDSYDAAYLRHLNTRIKMNLAIRLFSSLNELL